MKGILYLVFILVFASSYAQRGAITKNTGDFNELKVFDRIEVTLIKSNENKVVITGIKKREVDVILKDDILKIRMSLENIWDESNTEVSVFYKELSVIDVNEGSIVRARQTIEANKLEFRAQEGGKIYAEIEAGLFYAKAVTGGEIFPKGKVNEQDINIQAGGQFYGKRLACDTAQVKISAGGYADVYVTDYIKANTTAGGIIKIYGNPKEIDSKKVLGGKIIEVN